MHHPIGAKKTILLLSLLAIGCWASPRAQAQDLSGRWKGTWSAAANAKHGLHTGPLRVRLVSTGPGTYRGLFTGRFAVVVPYIYRAKVTQYGQQVVSSRRLGPLGEYRMTLFSTPNRLDGGWSAAGESGAIHLNRR